LRDGTIDTFLKEKPARVLLALRELDEPYAREVSSTIDSNYSHTVKLLNRLTEQGVVSSYKRGRKRIFELTPMGDALAENFADINQKMSKWPGSDEGEKAFPIPRKSMASTF